MGRRTKLLRALISRGTTEPPTKYSFRHERKSISYTEDLARITQKRSRRRINQSTTTGCKRAREGHTDKGLMKSPPKYSLRRQHKRVGLAGIEETATTLPVEHHAIEAPSNGGRGETKHQHAKSETSRRGRKRKAVQDKNVQPDRKQPAKSANDEKTEVPSNVTAGSISEPIDVDREVELILPDTTRQGRINQVRTEGELPTTIANNKKKKARSKATADGSISDPIDVDKENDGARSTKKTSRRGHKRKILQDKNVQPNRKRPANDKKNAQSKATASLVCKPNGVDKEDDDVRSMKRQRKGQDKALLQHMLEEKDLYDQHTILVDVDRISSKSAADLIERERDWRNVRDEPPLLIITTDASAGKTSGAASILRQVGRHSDRAKACVQFFPWAESGPAEVAAVALACRTAVEDGVSGHRVLILVDCLTAIDFYDPQGKDGKYEHVLADAADFKLSMSRLVGISSSVKMAHIKSNHTKRSGFFDHEAADLLADAARKSEAYVKSFHHEWVDGVRRLDPRGVDWLRDTENKHGSASRGSEKSRKSACRKQIRKELGIKLHT